MQELTWYKTHNFRWWVLEPCLINSRTYSSCCLFSKSMLFLHVTIQKNPDFLSQLPECSLITHPTHHTKGPFSLLIAKNHAPPLHWAAMFTRWSSMKAAFSIGTRINVSSQSPHWILLDPLELRRASRSDEAREAKHKKNEIKMLCMYTWYYTTWFETQEAIGKKIIDREAGEWDMGT
jgi:hypothetical protein